MTLDEWKSIKDGQIIYAASGLQREVVKGCSSSLCITLKAVRKTLYGGNTTVYDRQCRRNFFLMPPQKNNAKIHSRVIQQQITVNEIFLNDQPIKMGDNIAQLIDIDCEIHGKQKGLLGFNNQTLDPVTVCLECCKAVIAHIK